MRSLDSEQIAYARETVARLWPAPAQVDATTRRAPHSQSYLNAEWLLLPSPTHPTLLVPSDLPQAANMLQRHGNRLLPRVGRASLGWGIRTGALRRLPAPRIQVTYSKRSQAQPPITAIAHLATSIPDAQSCGIILGTPRPNRKPVLRLFSGDGGTLGFVKVGVSEYTSRLVQTEAANLDGINSAGLRRIRAPQVLVLDTFDDLDLLALSPMESSQVRRELSIPLDAMRELAHLTVVRGEQLDTSTYWSGLTRAVASAGVRKGASECAHLMRRISERWGASPIDFGSWHGDWAPWNMGYRDGVVELWDWERYATDVPIGFDAIHFQAQQVRHGRSDTSARESALLRQTPDLLARMDSPPGAGEPRLILALYLLEISVRFAGMADEREDATLHPRARWALDFAADLVR